ncbi:DUF4429 domain-containing protein [Streptomyces sp. NPDC007100]|uniref:DUF4429 domain-containing protein n=1 Tax=unclassified Streptomyces TaxID=2593676 RepID=UPI0033FCC959
MAELMVRDGTWSFDGDQVRIVPGQERGVHRLRQDLGEISVPLTALAGIAYEPARKGGRLRLRLRDGADPLLYVTGGGLPDDANPYQVTVDPDRTGVAEYFADEVRQALLLDQVATGPTDRYLLPGPSVPLSAAGVDGVATFDGEHVHIEWRWTTSESKKHAGARDFALADLDGVDWHPAGGLEPGYLRFRPKGLNVRLKPEHDPNAIELWGFKKESGRTALLAAAVAARLPHPAAPAAPVAGPEAAPALEKKAAPPGDGSGGEGADVLLRRLRELGELHRDGILTAEEFTAAKAAVLKDFHGAG